MDYVGLPSRRRSTATIPKRSAGFWVSIVRRASSSSCDLKALACAIERRAPRAFHYRAAPGEPSGRCAACGYPAIYQRNTNCASTCMDERCVAHRLNSQSRNSTRLRLAIGYGGAAQARACPHCRAHQGAVYRAHAQAGTCLRLHRSHGCARRRASLPARSTRWGSFCGWNRTSQDQSCCAALRLRYCCISGLGRTRLESGMKD